MLQLRAALDLLPLTDHFLRIEDWDSLLYWSVVLLTDFYNALRSFTTANIYVWKWFKYGISIFMAFHFFR